MSVQPKPKGEYVIMLVCMGRDILALTGVGSAPCTLMMRARSSGRDEDGG